MTDTATVLLATILLGPLLGPLLWTALALGLAPWLLSAPLLPALFMGAALATGRLWRPGPVHPDPAAPTEPHPGEQSGPGPRAATPLVPSHARPVLTQPHPVPATLLDRATFERRASTPPPSDTQGILAIQCQSISDLHLTDAAHAGRLTRAFTATLRRTYPDARLLAQINDHTFLLLLPRPDQRLRRAVLDPIPVGRQILYPRVRASQSAWRATVPVRTAVRAAIAGLDCASDTTLTQVDEQPAQTRRQQVQLEQALRHALSRGQLQVHYQPIVRLDSGDLVKAEALIRWPGHDLGPVPPSRIVDLAEQLGQIEPLTDLVIHRALHEARRAGAILGRDVRMAVNLTPAELNAPHFMDRMALLLGDHPDAPRRLAFEVTERGALTDPARTGRHLSTLRDWGFGLALDDFGTGHSALSLLRHLPVHHLKLDRSFLWGIEHSDQLRILTGAVLDLATRLNVEVVAEAIETPAHVEILRALGCPLGQGFLYSRPQAQPNWAAYR